MPAPPPPPRTWRAVLALFVVTLIWGGTFVWMKEGIDAGAAAFGERCTRAGIALFTMLRFGVSALVVAAAVPAARRGLGARAWRGGLLLGGLLFAGFVLQMVGLADVSPAVSAFLTSLYVLFTAAITALAGRRGLGIALLAGALLATAGAGFIRGRPELSFTLGELLTVACALVFAVHILATARVTKALPALPVTLTSFVVVAAGGAAMLALELAREPSVAAAIPALLATRAFLVPLALSCVLATVVAITLMNVFQRELSPVRAAILYALEPIWAALYGVASGYDRVDHHLWIGGALLLGGNLVAELGEQRRARAGLRVAGGGDRSAA